VLTGLLSAILIGPAGTEAELAVKGDTAAWNELAVAFKKLGALSAYREKRTVSTKTPE
jgi:hypothetical protein